MDSSKELKEFAHDCNNTTFLEEAYIKLLEDKMELSDGNFKEVSKILLNLLKIQQKTNNIVRGLIVYLSQEEKNSVLEHFERI